MNDTKGHACRVCRRRGVVGDTGFPSTIYCRKVSEIIKYSRGTYIFRKLLLLKYTVLKNNLNKNQACHGWYGALYTVPKTLSESSLKKGAFYGWSGCHGIYQ